MSQPEKLKRKEYEALLEPLQRELAMMARWASTTGQRILVLLEGRDTAGKGGAIDAIRAHINPRQCRVVALPKPNDSRTGRDALSPRRRNRKGQVGNKILSDTRVRN